MSKLSSKKILMLHGYVQSDTIFRSKSGALRKQLKKMGYEAYLPCGPHLIRYKELQDEGTDLSAKYNTADAEKEKLYGWYKIPPNCEPGKRIYEIKQDTLDYIRDYVIENGPFDGIIGFSQGAGVAGYLLTDFNKILNLTEEQQPPFKFFVSFCGFRLEPPQFQQQYDENPISIPSLLVRGELDMLVTEERFSRLFNSCNKDKRTELIHPGAHFIPSKKEFLQQVCAWIQSQTIQSKTIDPNIKGISNNLKSKLDSKPSNKPDLDDDLLKMIDGLGTL